MTDFLDWALKINSGWWLLLLLICVVILGLTLPNFISEFIAEVKA